MSKQNSVEWIVVELEKLTGLKFKGEPIVQQANTMHQTEVEEAYFSGQKNGNSYGYNGVVFVNKAKYYKQTFGIKKNEKRS